MTLAQAPPIMTTTTTTFVDINVDILTCHDEVYAGTEEDPVGWVVKVGEEGVGQEVVVHLGQVLDLDFSKYR